MLFSQRTDKVPPFIHFVRTWRLVAVERYALKFDKWDSHIEMTPEDIAAAIARVPAKTREDIDFAHEQVRAFADAQRASIQDMETTLSPGVIAGHKNMPVDCAGCYVPGGRFAHIASAIMTVTTAKAAGCPKVVACSPPRGKEGIACEVVYAMHIAGCDHILTLGGVQGMAAMAFGLYTGQPASIIVGPGNRFIVEAKRYLFGRCGIDLIAGPTEAAVIADDTADPFMIATDLTSQAEHGPDSPCVLITTSMRVGEAVRDLMPKLIADLPPSCDIAKVSWADYGEIVVVDSREEAAAVSDEVGSEHLEVQVSESVCVLRRRRKKQQQKTKRSSAPWLVRVRTHRHRHRTSPTPPSFSVYNFDCPYDNSNFSRGKYLARRASAARACASIPSARDMRAVTCATCRVPSWVRRWYEHVLRNFPTKSPPE